MADEVAGGRGVSEHSETQLASWLLPPRCGYCKKPYVAGHVCPQYRRKRWWETS